MTSDTSELAQGHLAGRPQHSASGLVILLLAMLAFIVVLSYAMTAHSLSLALVVGLTVALGVLCFVRAKWVIYILIFASLFSPELTVGDVLGGVAKRAPSIRIEDLLLVVIMITWLARAAVNKELGLMLRTPLNRPMFFYAFVCIIATGIGVAYGWVDERTGAALFVLKYIQYFILFFVVVNHIDSPRDVRNLVIAGVLTYLAICLYGLVQLPIMARPSTPGEQYGEPNTLAGYLLFMMGICTGMLLFARSGRGALMWGGLTALGFVLLVYTLSRSGWAGLVGILAVLVLRGRHRYAVLTALVAAAAILVLISFQSAWLPEPVQQRWRETRGQYDTWPGMPQPVEVLGVKLDPSASERYRSYEKALSQWGRRSLELWVPVLTGSGVLGSSTFVDGQYVRVLVETGLLGLVAFAILMVAIWRNAWRAYTEVETPWHKGLAFGYLAGFAGLLVHAIGANTFIIVRIMEPFFIFTGIVMLLPAIEHPEHRPEDEHQ